MSLAVLTGASVLLVPHKYAAYVAFAPLVPAISHGIAGGYAPALLVLCAVTTLTLLAAIGWRDPREARRGTARR